MPQLKPFQNDTATQFDFQPNSDYDKIYIVRFAESGRRACSGKQFIGKTPEGPVSA
jgi:hypothetical protein